MQCAHKKQKTVIATEQKYFQGKDIQYNLNFSSLKLKLKFYTGVDKILQRNALTYHLKCGDSLSINFKYIYSKQKLFIL